MNALNSRTISASRGAVRSDLGGERGRLRGERSGKRHGTESGERGRITSHDRCGKEDVGAGVTDKVVPE
jgi:hypothetical protein